MQEFISEDDLETFEGWLRYQGFDAAMLESDELAEWRDMFEKVRKDSLATPKVGLMKLPRIAGEYRDAVAVREGSDLWLALWVKRSKKGEFFVMLPRQDSGWDVHTSYHLNGTRHMKSFGHKTMSDKLQPLSGTFSGNGASWGEYGIQSETRRGDLRPCRLLGGI